MWCKIEQYPNIFLKTKDPLLMYYIQVTKKHFFLPVFNNKIFIFLFLLEYKYKECCWS